MRLFRDSKGTEWKIEITIAAVKRVKALLPAVDLLEVSTGDPPLIVRLSVDVILLCDVLYALCKPEADARGISDEQFGELMGGDALLSGQKAFMEEIVDFFQKLGRTEQATVVQQAGKMVRATIAAANAKIESVDIEGMSQRVVGKLFGDAQASLESTLIPEHSAN